MTGGESPRPAAWGGAQTTWRNTSSSQSRSSQSATSSAFPPLSSQSSPRRSPAQWRQTNSSSSSFNPYRTRNEEIAERAQYHAHRRRSQLTRRDPDIATLRSYEHSDEEDFVEPEGEDARVSSRGATMSSIVFRDYTARSSTAGPQSLSPGLAMFARSSFGGEPLALLSHMDNELRAAHMGPRIYHRHNQKYVQAKRRIRSNPAPDLNASVPVQTIGAASVVDPSSSPQTNASSDRSDLPSLMQKYLNHKLAVVASGNSPTEFPIDRHWASLEDDLIRLIENVVSDPLAWSHGRRPITQDLLLASHDLIVYPTSSHLTPAIRIAVVKGIVALLTKFQDVSNVLQAEIVAHLISLTGLKPSSAVGLEQATLQSAVMDAYVRLLELLTTLDSSTQLLETSLKRMSHSSSTDPLRSLTSDLIAFCGQQLAGNPTVLDESQDRNLAAAAEVLARLSKLNSQRSSPSRLPAHAFYCTVLDLCPFLEHYVHRANAFTRQRAGCSTAPARFNACHYPFMLSLGAKARILQLENELRFSSSASKSRVEHLAFAAGLDSPGRLVVMHDSMKLTVQRYKSREQSQDVLLQLFHYCQSLETYDALIKPLRVDFDGELAIDGGGPTREWFATVLASYRPTSLASHGWFVPSDSSIAVDEARFLGLVLALAALHSAKVSLGFDLSSIAFELVKVADIDNLSLSSTQLQAIDPPLAKSLQAVLDWSPDEQSDPELQFDDTFSLTWSTSVQDVNGEVRVVDLVPQGRHRTVKLTDRAAFVSKLVWRVLVGSVRDQVLAFRNGWHAIMPYFDKSYHSEDSTDVICRGGLAVSLFEAAELGETTCSVPAERGAAASHAFQPLDMADLENATVLVLGGATVGSASAAPLMASFWAFWAGLVPVEQRKLLAFITGSQDIPLTGAQGIGLRIHLIHAQNLEIACHAEDGSWPLPWSSTCTSTLFLPAYPSTAMMQKKLLVAIEHYRGFGLR